MSAPMSRCRTRSPRSRCRSRTSARARSAPPIRCGTTTARCARPIPTSRASSPISTPRRRAGTAVWRARSCSAPAAARAPCCYALIAREVERIYVINRSDDAGEGAAQKFGARVHRRRWDEITGLLGGVGLLVNTTTLGMDGQPPLDINLALPGFAGGGGSGLRSAGHRAADGGARRADCARPTGSACCCIRRCAASSAGSAYGREVTAELRALVEADLLKKK